MINRCFAVAALATMTVMNIASAADLERADPASAGMNPAALAKLKVQMTALVENGDRSGLAYAIARDGKIVAMEALGKRNLERNLPMEIDTQFRVYSMTRPFTGSAALSLIEEGKLSLDDQVAKYIPDVAKMKVMKADKETLEDQRTPLTVRHLQTYTAGLGYAPDWPAKFSVKQSDVLNPDITIEQGIANLAKRPLLYQPGSKWHYGFSGDMLGRVVEVAAGQPLDVVLRQRVLDKVGMPSTGFWNSPQDSAAGRLAEVYGRKGAHDKLVNVSANAPALSSFNRPGKMFSGGGGLVSTVPDYLRFAQMLLNGGIIDGKRVLKAETVQAMLTQQTTADQGSVYWYAPGQFTSVTGWMWGYSIGVRPENAGADVPGQPGERGWSGLANTFFLINLKERVAAVIMAQYQGPNSNDMSAVFREGVYGAIEKR